MTYGTETPTSGFIGRIPVRNIWLLLLYASRLIPRAPRPPAVSSWKMPRTTYRIWWPRSSRTPWNDACAATCPTATSAEWADLSRVRGRIDLFRTERRQLLQRGRVACVFDELTVDTPRNRYVKAALTHIAGVVSKLANDSDLERRCRDLAVRLERAGVVGHLDPRYAGEAAVLDNAGWVDAHERQMLAAARLALNLSIPTEQSGVALLPIVNRSETEGWRLYENAVAGFYDVTLSHRGWKVRQGSRIQWPAVNPTPGLNAIMPEMITDIVLERRDHSTPDTGQKIVIDTKFTSIVAHGQFGRQMLKSGHMYQLYAYLRSQEQPGDSISCHATGVLLYPSLGVDYNESAIIQGHRITFATVDLAADSQTIRNQLLRIVDNQ